MLEICLGVLLVLLLGLYLLQKRQIRRLAKELEHILQEEPTNRLLGQEVTSKEVTLLVSAVNRLLVQNRLHARLYRTEADKLQQSLTHLSHDLRTPLASMDGYLQLMGENRSAEDLARYHAVLTERMNYTRNLMDQYFLSLKYENKQTDLPLSPLDPNELFLICLLSFTAQFEQKGLEPSVQLISEHIQISGHEELLLRLYQNLIQNALTHGIDYLTVESTVLNGAYRLCLKNGLKEDHRPDPDRIFDRFYKGDSMRTVESTGLGMSIARSLAHQLNGEIQVSVNGNTFAVTLLFPLLIR